jgi:hypothetical protein
MSDREEHGEFCTISYAAKRTGLAVKTWYRGGAGTDQVPRVRFGRTVRLLRSDLERFVSERIAKSNQKLKPGPG